MRFEDRAFSGSLAAGLAFGFTLFQTFVQVPLLLKFWGAETYGIWLILCAIMTLINCLDVGHQTYVGNVLCRVTVRSPHRLKWIVGSAVRMSVFLGVVELLVTGIIVFGGLSKLFGLPADDQQVGSKLGLVVYSAYWLLLGSVGGVLVRLYAARGMFARMITWGTVIRFLQFCALILAASLGSTPGGAVVAQCAIGLLVHVFLFVDLLKSFPDLFPWWRSGRLAQGFRYFTRSVVLTCNSAIEQVSANASVFFISGILGPAALPLFATLRMVANSMTQATSILLTPLAPEMVRLHFRKEEEKLRQTIATAWFVGGFLNFGFLVLALFIGQLFEVWTRGRLTFSFGLFGLLGFSTLLRSFGSPLTLYISSLNRLREQTIIVMSRLLIVLAAGGALLNWWGVMGMASAIVLAELISSMVLPLRLAVIPGTGILPYRGGANAAVCHVMTTGLVLVLAAIFPGARVPVISAGLALLVLQSRWQWLSLSDDVRHRLRSLLRERFARIRPLAWILRPL